VSPAQIRTLWATLLPTLLWAGWLIGYDVWTYRRHGNESTISYVMWKVGREWTIFPVLASLLLGVLIGHFWWPQDKSGGKAEPEPGPDDPPPTIPYA
jgi:hypothetical protein